MKRLRRLLWLAALLGISGCNTYHYFDVTIVFDSTLPEEQVGFLQSCSVLVSGAATDSNHLPMNPPGAKSYCPVTDFHNFPTLGTFEYSTFADSGKLTFTFQGFDYTMQAPMYQCAMGSVDVNATSEVTQTATLTVTAGPNPCMSQTQ
jgi:hypothetical protein